MTTGKLQGPKLEGKVAIVTGAALGMGNAVAHRFTAEGANVVVADIREAEGKALADELGPSAVFAALELGPWGIRVNSIHPGGVDTPMTAELGFRGPGVAAPVPLGRYGTPDDIASLHLFLVSDEASWITGAEIYIDGGSMAGPRPAR